MHIAMASNDTIEQYVLQNTRILYKSIVSDN